MLFSVLICGVYYIVLLQFTDSAEQAVLRREFLLVCSAMILVSWLLGFRTPSSFSDILSTVDMQLAAKDLLLLFPMRRLLNFI